MKSYLWDRKSIEWETEIYFDVNYFLFDLWTEIEEFNLELTHCIKMLTKFIFFICNFLSIFEKLLGSTGLPYIKHFIQFWIKNHGKTGAYFHFLASKLKNASRSGDFRFYGAKLFSVCLHVWLCVGVMGDQSPLHLQSTTRATANTPEDLLRFLPRKRGRRKRRASRRWDEEFPAHRRKAIRHVPSIVRRENVNGAWHWDTRPPINR